MQIQKLYFKKHKLFKDHEVVFCNEKGNIPKITYLVGNNGSGKTHILETIYYSLFQPFSNGSEDYVLDLDLILNQEEIGELDFSSESNIVYSISREQNSNSHNIKTKVDNNIKDGSIIQKISKIVYSTVEINFTTPPVKGITSKTTDEQENPKEKSSNLGNEIPQLLVDIQALDNAEKGRWIDDNKKNNKDASVVIPHSKFVNRLERFTSIFDKMFDGQKKFKDIETKDDQKNIVFVDKDGNDTSIPDLSSGEKQIIFRIGYILKNLVNIKGGIILIDEPEISLHPVWQTRFKKILLEVFDGLDVQIIIATHSPYIFQDLDQNKERCIKIDNKIQSSQEIKLNYNNKMFLSPSVNLVGYKAFGVFDEMLHIELYSLLQSFTQRTKINCRVDGVDCKQCMEHLFLQTVGIAKKTFTGSTTYNSDKKAGKPIKITETLPTFIRNRIHHPDEKNRIYTKEDLESSIKYLLSFFI